MNEFKKIIDNLKDEECPNKGPVTLYMSKDVFEEFKIACEGVKPSRAIEKLMRLFIQGKKR